MNHRASIYANPLILNGFYYAKLLDVHVETGEQPYLWASLLARSNSHDAADVRLSSIIYRSSKSEELLTKFRWTFRIEDDTIDAHLAALGRWGCVGVVTNTYQQQEYSAVIYIQQNLAMRNISRLLANREKMIGEPEWPEHLPVDGETAPREGCDVSE